MSININDYSQEQVESWAPDSQIFRTYPESFAYVAEIDGKAYSSMEKLIQ